MNTRIQQAAICVVLAGVVFAAPVAMADKKDKQSKVKTSGDQFQLTISKVPYSTNPESDYVRIYCAPGKKHKKSPRQKSSKIKN